MGNSALPAGRPPQDEAAGLLELGEGPPPGGGDAMAVHELFGKPFAGLQPSRLCCGAKAPHAGRRQVPDDPCEGKNSSAEPGPPGSPHPQQLGSHENSMETRHMTVGKIFMLSTEQEQKCYKRDSNPEVICYIEIHGSLNRNI